MLGIWRRLPPRGVSSRRLLSSRGVADVVDISGMTARIVPRAIDYPQW
jgi:hypothetical protein